MVVEDVRLTPEGGRGGLLWVGIGVLTLALASGAFWWFKKTEREKK